MVKKRHLLLFHFPFKKPFFKISEDDHERLLLAVSVLQERIAAPLVQMDRDCFRMYGKECRKLVQGYFPKELQPPWTALRLEFRLTWLIRISRMLGWGTKCLQDCFSTKIQFKKLFLSKYVYLQYSSPN